MPVAPTSPRLAVVTVAVTAVVVLAVAVLVGLAVRHDPTASGTPAHSAATGPSASVRTSGGADVAVDEAVESGRVLSQWDRQRAAAYAEADVPALRRLYLPGSAAGARDVRVLRQWRSRGLCVQDMEMQVLALELVGRTEGRVRLLVTDRLSGAVAVPLTGDGPELALPEDGASTRLLDFRRHRGRWVLAGAYPRPLETTAVTSSSANE